MRLSDHLHLKTGELADAGHELERHAFQTFCRAGPLAMDTFETSLLGRRICRYLHISRSKKNRRPLNARVLLFMGSFHGVIRNNHYNLLFLPSE